MLVVFGCINVKGVLMNVFVLCFVICVLIFGIYFVSGGDLFLMFVKSSGVFVMIVWIFIIVVYFVMCW